MASGSKTTARSRTTSETKILPFLTKLEAESTRCPLCMENISNGMAESVPKISTGAAAIFSRNNEPLCPVQQVPCQDTGGDKTVEVPVSTRSPSRSQSHSPVDP
ncbi:unnamed protein product [Eretmochelys imbricata]